ncbi:MAG TPA: GNAT family N-acetyltransferase [Blastocatellia bacterium]|nr:GNAT family N-acetyltransferase [Blastocatellia bacterium]
MPVEIRQARSEELETLIPLLLQAEPSESALRWSLAHLSDTAYRLDDDGQLVGAATIRWRDEPCEIVEIAISEERHGQGLGKQFIEWLIAEARRRGKRDIVVGTGNASVNNIIFYQKCGFRMDHVRHDYFWYYQEPIFEHGIRVRDMLVFRYDLTEGASASLDRRE